MGVLIHTASLRDSCSPRARTDGIRCYALAILFSIPSIALPAASVHAAVSIPLPTVSKAPDRGTMWDKAPVDLSAHGLMETEYFFQGVTLWGGYKSRMIVRRPIDPAHFNGTVIVEWMNASSGVDIDVDFLPLLPLIEKEGYAYVAVTAQHNTARFLVDHDADRYSGLSINEASRFGVFSQAAEALLKNGRGVDPLQGLKAERLIAIGQSQSSQQLTAYLNRIHGIVYKPVFDAFVLHSSATPPARFPVPVFKINSESEAPDYYKSRDVSNPNYVYWEVAGTSHQPLKEVDYANSLLAESQAVPFSCPFPYEGPGGPVPIEPVLRAAIYHVGNWIRFEIKPPAAPLIDMAPDPSNPGKGVILRDEFGNARGGIRMPQQEVPTGRNTPSYGCVVDLPFPPYSLTMDLYPQYDAFDDNNDPAVDPTDVYNEPTSAGDLYHSHSNYVRSFTNAAIRAYINGYVLWFDVVDMVREATDSKIAD